MQTKILIIRFSSIGDIVLTTPVVRCLKNQLEGEVEIHYLVKEQYAEILQANPFIDEIHTIKKDVKEAIPGLKRENFHYIVDLHNNIRSFQVKKQLKVLSFTFDKINLKKWMMVNLKVNRLPDIHIVDRYMAAVKPLGVKSDGKGIDYHIPTKAEISPEALPDGYRHGYVAFAIGGTYATKKLPEKKIAAVCKKLKDPVILLGGEQDLEAGDKIVSLAGNNVFNGCGKYSINQSASLIWQSKKVITHDTGMMHIAAAFNKEIVSVWGNTIPAFGMYPYLEEGERKSHIIEVKDLSCRPCSKLGHQKCPKKHFKCMEMIDEDRIVDLINGSA